MLGESGPIRLLRPHHLSSSWSPSLCALSSRAVMSWGSDTVQVCGRLSYITALASRPYIPAWLPRDLENIIIIIISHNEMIGIRKEVRHVCGEVGLFLNGLTEASDECNEVFVH